MNPWAFQMLYLLIGKGNGNYLFKRMDVLSKLIWPFDAKWIKLNRLGVLCLRIFSQWLLFPSVSLDSSRSEVRLGLLSARITNIEMP